MWLLCMFDLPVQTKRQMRLATQFRNHLLDNGFCMKQFSVYIKPCRNLAAAKIVAQRIKYGIPPEGQISIFYITDRQYTMAENFIGPNLVGNEQQDLEKNGCYLLF